MAMCLVKHRDKFALSIYTHTPTLGPTKPPVQWVLGVKQLECEANLSPPSNDKVKNA